MNLEYQHLIGRSYDPARANCYTLGRHFFKDVFGIELGDYAIPADWNASKLDLIGMIHEREGFEKLYEWDLKTIRPGDVLCTAIRTTNPNHFVVYVGNNKVLHHPLNSLSREEPMGEFYRMVTLYVLRHPDVPDLRPKLPDVTLQELVDARYFPQTAA